jgi:hypothetical protein
MDRGIPTEETLERMRTTDPPVHYLVGTPMGQKAPGPHGVAFEMCACGVAPLARTASTVGAVRLATYRDVQVPREAGAGSGQTRISDSNAARAVL